MEMKLVILVLLVTLLELAGLPPLSSALDLDQLRMVATKHNVTSMLVFGDSSVDPGNNDFINTDMKGNFPPYGKNFFGRRATGRFCDGRLATDFIAEAAGYKATIPAFLDPKLTPTNLMHGVSFASAASGYDDLTANFSNVLSFPEQLNYFRHYKIHLKKLVGPSETQKMINNAIFLLSMGTNDFLQNYFLEDIRPKQFTLTQYLDFLASRMFSDVMMLQRQGARRLVVVGVPPLGCMPLVKTLRNENSCVEQLNKVAFSFNTRLKKNLAILRSKTGIKTIYVDAYAAIIDAIKSPKKYGLTETSKGCCGTGTFEYGDTCKGMHTCEDPSKYVFWDAVHPTQRMYQILAERAVGSLGEDFFF